MVTASLIELEIDIDIVDSGELGLSGVLRLWWVWESGDKNENENVRRFPFFFIETQLTNRTVIKKHSDPKPKPTNTRLAQLV